MTLEIQPHTLPHMIAQGLLENGQDTDRQNFYFLYLTENENLALISFEDL